MPAVAPVMDDEISAAVMERFTEEIPGNDGAGRLSPAPSDISVRIADELRERIGEERFDLWFDRKARLVAAGNTLLVEAPNQFSCNWIAGKFRTELLAAASEVMHRDVQVQIRVAEKPVVEATERLLPDNPKGPATVREPLNIAVLNPRHGLDEFVVGPSNQLAYHAARRVAELPGRQFNPLFLHGHCGLGKTHLLQGICLRFSKLHPGKKWLYITAEQFTNEFLEAIRAHKTDAFRRRLRGVELLVIDDVHFLANKKATQEEFLHTFNQIDASGRQIVLASDCGPKQIQALSEQLSSRFVSGMVLRVDSPDLPTRLEILRRRVARNQWNINDTVLMHIARTATSSVRELEGLLLQVVAGVQLINAGSPETGAVLASIKDRTAMRGPIPMGRIVSAVAEHFSLVEDVILGSGREKTISAARAVTMYLARQHTGMSFPEIGRAIGGKNHSTVIAACQRVEAMLTGGELLCWNAPGGARHQAIADILHDLEAAIRRVR